MMSEQQTKDQWLTPPLLQRGRPYDGAIEKDGRLVIPRPGCNMRRVYEIMAEQTRKQARLYDLMSKRYGC